jgi:hypothetical protein
MPSRLLFRLGSHSKQVGNEPGLLAAVSFVSPVHLPFPQHVHHLVPLQRSPRRLEGTEPQSWLDEPFDKAMILLDQIVEILHLPQVLCFGEESFGFQVLKRFGRRRVVIDGDDPRSDGMRGKERLLEEPFGSSGISGCTQQELERLSCGIHGSIQIHPGAFDLEVRLIDAPRIGGGFQMWAAASVEFWGVVLDGSGRWWCDRCANPAQPSSLPGRGS